LKVHTALQDDPHVFQRPDAPLILGVGSSMVASMRFWAGAFGLVEEDTEGPPGAAAPTARGRWLLDEEDGADPYLEDQASLWLLHWWLLTGTPCHVPSWYFVFAVYGRSRFTRAELLSSIQRAVVRSGWRPPADDTVRRDIACLATMYAPQVGSVDQPRASLEDVLANQFGDLGLLSTAAPRSRPRADRSHEITVVAGAGRSAPAGVLLYACLDFAARGAASPGSIVLSRLASGPGRIMRLDSGALRQALERAASRHPAVSVVESGAGETVLAYDAPPAVLADQVLAGVFQRPGPAGA
jgi:hypothetical protein